MDTSDTPAAMIARLDGALSRRGQTVTVRKANVATPAATVMAFVRGLQASDLAGTTLSQSDHKVTISPTGLEPVGIPSDNWQVVIDGFPRTVVGRPEVIKVADVVVRINMLVKG